MSLDKDRKRTKAKPQAASVNVTMMLMELADVHADLLAVIQRAHGASEAGKYEARLDDAMAQIHDAVKEADHG